MGPLRAWVQPDRQALGSGRGLIEGQGSWGLLRTGLLVLFVTTTVVMASCGPPAGPCQAPRAPVVAEITSRALPGIVLRSFVAVQSHDSTYEQLYFISARVSGAHGSGVATWVTDSIDVVRRGACGGGAISCSSPNLQPIILNANATARAATPSLRPNTTPEVPRPSAKTRAAKKSQRCVSST